MNDFAGMEELMQGFLAEGSGLLADVDSKLIGLGRTLHDRDLLNVMFRCIRTIKGGAGFLNATELVTLCHLTGSLFDKLRNGELFLTTGVMGVISAAIREIRQMLGALAQNRQPDAAPPHVIAALHVAMKGEAIAATAASQAIAPQTAAPQPTAPQPAVWQPTGELNWNWLYQSLVGGALFDPAFPGGAEPVSPAPALSVPSPPPQQ